MREIFDSVTYNEKGNEVTMVREKKNSYEQYRKAGGIINEKDYVSALLRAKGIKMIDKSQVAQAELMARVAGIELEDSTAELDPRVALYAVLRGNTNLLNSTPEEQYLRDRDQLLFAEVLRMLGDIESLKKFTAYFSRQMIETEK